MIPVLLQTLDEATGEFDPLGTLFVLVLTVLFAFGVRGGWRRYRSRDGTRRFGWLAGAGVCALFFVVFVAALAVNLAAAVGII